MSNQGTSIGELDTEFDPEAAEGLNDEEYLAAGEIAAVQDAAFDPEAASGLSDEEYLQNNLAGQGGTGA